MDYAINFRPAPALPVAESNQAFPAGRIYCVGRNYAGHARVWNVPGMIAGLSRLITLRAGDLILSGTPAGVGPVKAGDRLEGHVDGVGDLNLRAVEQKPPRGAKPEPEHVNL